MEARAARVCLTLAAAQAALAALAVIKSSPSSKGNQTYETHYITFDPDLSGAGTEVCQRWSSTLTTVVCNSTALGELLI
jgi:hypothetical protein